MPGDEGLARPEIVRTDRKMVYRNHWMTVWEDQVLFPDGSSGSYGCVDKSDFALIVPFDGLGFYLVEQYRYPVDGRYWEFPQGSLESAPDANVLEVAKQELREEVGIGAESFEVLGNLYEAYGFSNQGFTVFLATGLSLGQSNPEVSELGMTWRRFEPEEVWDLIRDGKMKDAPSIAALALVTRRLDTA
jgi:ADP-ribose pyrophosphatase